MVEHKQNDNTRNLNQNSTSSSLLAADDKTRIQSLDALDSNNVASVSIQVPAPEYISNAISIPIARPVILGTSLEKIASSILMVIAALRQSHKHIDLTKLRQGLTLEINSFDVKARTANIPDNKILLARYILCAVIDEFVLETPWGANSNWSEYSMLNTFHQDSAGGQKFFVIVDKILLDPTNYVDLLELVYICLQLGYLGKYRIMQGGLNQLAVIKQNIYQQICNQRGVSERNYGVYVKPLSVESVPAIKRVPTFKFTLATIIVLVLIFGVFSVMLHLKSSNVEKGLRSIVVEHSVDQIAGTRQPSVQ